MSRGARKIKDLRLFSLFIALRLHFLFHFLVVSCSVLVACIVCNALRGGCILKHPGQLVGNFKIGVGIQMTIGSKGCLYFFMPQTLFDQQGILAHADEQGGMGMPLRYNNDKRKKPLFSRSLSVCRYLFNSFSKLKYDETIIKKRRLFH